MAKKLDFALAALKQAVTNKPAYVPETILEASERIVQKALHTLQKHEKVILAIGEIHDNEAHHWLEANVLAELAANNVPVTLAIEQPANLMEHSVPAPRDATDAMFKGWDPLNHARTVLAIEREKFNQANVSSFWAPAIAALEMGLPIVFADSAKAQPRKNLPRAIDMRHEQTRQIAQKLGLETDEIVYPYKLAEFHFPWIRTTEDNGMKLRNHFMVQSCLQSPGYQQAGQHVILLQTGRAHLAGDPTQEFPQDESLATLFQEQGAKMISVRMADTWGISTFPLRLPLNDQNIRTPDTLYVSLTAEDDDIPLSLDTDEAFEKLGLPQYRPERHLKSAADTLEKMQDLAKRFFPEFKVRGW